jgi:signal transduction histidine kinase
VTTSTQLSTVVYVGSSSAEFSDEEQAALDSVNQKVAAGQSLGEIMDFLFDSTRSLFFCDRLGLALVEEDGRLVTQWVRADYPHLLLGKGYAEDLAGSTLEAVLAGGQARIIRDLRKYLECKPSSRSTRILVEEGVRSSLTVPLRVEGRPVGVLFRSSRQVDAYDDRQVALQQAVSERLSQAVEKVWLVEQARAATLAYTETLAFVSHELKGPLASLIMDGTVLLDGYAGSLDDVARRKVEAMVRKARGLHGFVQDYLHLARTETGLQPNVSPALDLATEVIEPALEAAATEIEAKGMRLERRISLGLRVDGDGDLLRVVVLNLVSNAVKYGDAGGRIRVTTCREADSVALAVWNEGPGFAPEQRPRLFRRFSRLSDPALLSRPGTGVGLYTSWRIVRVHGGRMDASSEHGSWAEFRFTLPVASSDRDAL